MTSYHWTFCTACRGYSCHKDGICMRHKEDITQMAMDQLAWEKRRAEYQREFTEMRFFQLMDIAKDLYARLEYEAKRMEVLADKEAFTQFMKDKW